MLLYSKSLKIIVDGIVNGKVRFFCADSTRCAKRVGGQSAAAYVYVQCCYIQREKYSNTPASDTQIGRKTALTSEAFVFTGLQCNTLQRISSVMTVSDLQQRYN